MAYHHNSSSGQNQYGNYQSSSITHSRHGSSAGHRPGSDHYLQRTPSFDHGDDSRHAAATNGNGFGQNYIAAGYRIANTAAMPNEGLGMRSPVFPSAVPGYGPGAGGYHHHDLPPTPTAQPPYNPQQYSPGQHQFSPPSINNAFDNFNPAYPAYIPSAYQPTLPQFHPDYGDQRPQSLASPVSPRLPIQQPPLPPPPPPPPPPSQVYDMRYDNSNSPTFGTTPFPQYSHTGQRDNYQQQPLPHASTTVSIGSRQPYTPPAPPPPPFSTIRDSFTTNNNSGASSRRYSHRGSFSQQQLSNRPPSLGGQLPSLPVYASNGNATLPTSNTAHQQTISPHLGLNNSLPPTPGTPGPTPPQHSPQRTNTTGRHPHARPLPGPPGPQTDYFDDSHDQNDTDDESNEDIGYDDLMKEVEAAVMGTDLSSHSRPNERRMSTLSHSRTHDDQDLEPRSLSETQTSIVPEESYARPNGHVNERGGSHYIDYDAYSDRSDAEAEAGLAAMYMADQQEAAEELWRNQGADSQAVLSESHQTSRYGDYATDLSSDSDVHVDMDTYGGGFSGHVHYGDQPVSQSDRHANLGELNYQHRNSVASSETPEMGQDIYDYSIPDQDDIHPFPPTLSARVDTGGTGGFAEPSLLPRRLSFEDGDESTLAESEGAQTSTTQSPSRDGMPDMFFHPATNTGRPLPAAPPSAIGKNRVPQLMPAGTYQHPERLYQYDQYGRLSYPPAPDAYNQLFTPSGTPVPRSSSLISHGTAPQAVTPLRSKTDADRARIRQQQLMGLRTASMYSETPDASIAQSAELLGLPEIPAGRRKKFNPGKLSSNDFKKCPEPWALSSVVTWIKDMSEDEADLKEQAIVDGIVALFTHKVPTMNTADAETLGARVVRAMFETGTLVKEEEWVKFGATPMSGVLFQMTGTGCYSPRVHTHTLPGRCYAHHCMRTLKKINLQSQILEPQRKSEDWATFYNVSKQTMEAADKKEVERQNVLHEIITTEDQYMDQLNILRILYRDELVKSNPPIIAPKRKDTFLRDVFSRADAIKQVNEDYLLAQLKYRQQEQGPWIVGFSDIFREWIRKAKNAYIDYAASFPSATFLMRQESERNILFREFLDHTRENERSMRLGWDTYLKAPITRLQRYSLLLLTASKTMQQDSEEKTNLKAAIEEIKAVTSECDVRVAEMSKHVELSELASKLVLRSGMEKVHLNLTHLGREIIFKGDLQRTGSNKFTWLETHAILFDHYLVLSKKSIQRDAAGGVKQDKYDVSKLPIPMDLLVLESTNDDPVVKAPMKGIGAVTTRAQTLQESRSTRGSVTSVNGTGGPGTLAHTNTGSSTASITTVTSTKTLNPPTILDGAKDEKLMFPFKIRHLGKAEMYTLYAPSAQNRQDWCEKIIQAKTRHAASLFKQNAEPFRLRVIADTAFGNDINSGATKSIIIKGTPLDRAIQEVEARFTGAGARPGFVCRAQVNCAAAFNHPYGCAKLAIGTDYGVYISDADNPRGWTRAINIGKVTQISILEEFSLFLLISDKSLVAYHLDAVCPVSGSALIATASDASSRRAPQKLSGNRDVGFFATGRMKDRTLVFYKKKEGISSTFKVLEPVYQKSSTNTRGRFGIRKGTTEFFREFDDFYIPSETYAINLFHSSLAIATAKGFEVMTLDKKTPLSIPDLKQPACASIAQRIRDQRPLGMFRLSDSEFLLVFEEVGIYVNKHGDISRAVVMEFVGRARQAALYGGTYLILVDGGGGFVEVRNAVNGRLRQVVSGKDVRLLDDGTGTGTAMGTGKGSVKICMQHPEWERCQIVVEMIVNEGLKE